jgi:hypothetical protein
MNKNCGFSCHFARVRWLAYGFLFSEKTSSFVRFFWRTKNRNEVAYKVTDPVFRLCETGEGNALIKNK